LGELGARLVTKSVFSEQYERFKQLLIEARKKAGLTQVELAERLCRPQSYVSKYERGERRLDVIEFLDVAEAIGIEPTEFLRDLDYTRSSKPPTGSS
jgi:transcriptional regulator with XRE-family HTH domain